jgi:L-threonylcarbamoyladenylate synthase
VTSIHQSGKPVERAALARAANVIARGGLVAFATETVYGLGADATNDKAVARIFAAKSRPAINPLIIHVKDTDTARMLANFNTQALRLANAFWPGPLTLVVPRKPGNPISDLACAGLDSVALRVPAHAAAQALLAEAGVPIAAPSANLSGRVSASEAGHARADLGDKVDLILDSGPAPLGLESTIIACLDNQARLLRPGAVTREAIEQVLGAKLAAPHDSDAPQAPGGLASHYAPRARLRLNAKKPEPGEALLGFGPAMPRGTGPALNLSATGDLTEAATNLFSYLRRLDGEADRIAVMPIPRDGLGLAINDRLERAAAPRP